MKNKKLIVVEIVATFLVILIGIGFISTKPNNNAKPPPDKTQVNKPLTANGQQIPEDSQAKAKNLGYYCPSWDAKPGQITSSICYKLDN